MDPNEVCRMAFTSGTTGDPKCVLHSFNTTIYAPWLLNRDMGVTERDVLLTYLPVGLNWGYITLMQTIMAGARAVLMERFSARAALELIERERVTYIPTAPAAIVSMLADPELGRFDLSSLRVVITGGASAAIETIRDYQARAKGHLIELYGMLETGFHTYTAFHRRSARRSTAPSAASSATWKSASSTARGNDVPYGEIGEVAARGPSVHLGYHNNPAANAASFTEDGWFRTGDLGRFVDAAGNVQLSGRSKEIINRGGKKFFPREVEEILYTHPNVMHAAMVGLPDARLGERNCLCVIPKSGRDLVARRGGDFPQGPDRRLQIAGDHRTLRRVPHDRDGENTPPHFARSGAGAAQTVSGLRRQCGLDLLDRLRHRHDARDRPQALDRGAVHLVGEGRAAVLEHGAVEFAHMGVAHGRGDAAVGDDAGDSKAARCRICAAPIRAGVM